MRAALQDIIQGRLRAAKVNGGASAAQPHGDGRYTVTGRADARYTVHVASLDAIACDCPAGIYGKPCWHAAAAYLRVVADSEASPELARTRAGRDERCAVCATTFGSPCAHRPDGRGLSVADLRKAGFTVAA
jgi:hypothetical protein